MKTVQIEHTPYDCLICANTNDFPDNLSQLAKNAGFVIACDGALDLCFGRRITPNIVIGDFDSTKSNNTVGFERVHIADQNSTDCQKALVYAKALGKKNIAVAGLNGGRFDHSLYHLKLLWQFHTEFQNLHWYGAEGVGWLTSSSQKITGKSKQGISFLSPFSEAEINLPDALYSVKNYTLSLTTNNSVSNAFTKNYCTLEVIKGTVFVYLYKVS